MYSAGLRYAIIQPLLNRLGKARFYHDGGALPDSQRLVKSDAELNCLRESERITAIGLRAAEAIIEPGITDNEVAAEGARALLAAGRATAQMHQIAEVCQRLYAALKEAMCPGNTFDDAARAAEAALAPYADRVFFSGVFGYSVGAQFPPSWVEGTGYIARGLTRRFEENMVFHLPLCLRLPGEWGIGLSDTVQVTAKGGVAITDNDWQINKQGGMIKS